MTLSTSGVSGNAPISSTSGFSIDTLNSVMLSSLTTAETKVTTLTDQMKKNNENVQIGNTLINTAITTFNDLSTLTDAEAIAYHKEHKIGGIAGALYQTTDYSNLTAINLNKIRTDIKAHAIMTFLNTNKISMTVTGQGWNGEAIKTTLNPTTTPLTLVQISNNLTSAKTAINTYLSEQQNKLINFYNDNVLNSSNTATNALNGIGKIGVTTETTMLKASDIEKIKDAIKSYISGLSYISQQTYLDLQKAINDYNVFVSTWSQILKILGDNIESPLRSIGQ